MWQSVPWYANWARVRLAYVYGENVGSKNYEIDPDWHADSPTISAANSALHNVCMAYLQSKIGHRPDLLEKCSPNYPVMAKRIVRDNGWFDALLRDNVDLVADPIERITPKGILMKDGKELSFDIIVLASGFRAHDFLFPMRIEGRGGLTLEQFWSKDGGRAYLGMMMPHFPNLWCMYGPNSNPRSGNPIQLSEIATRYVVGCLKALVDNDLDSLEVREDVFDEYQEKVDKALSTKIWNDPRQSSYYRNDKYGRIDVMTPWGATQFWHWTGIPDLDEFVREPHR